MQHGRPCTRLHLLLNYAVDQSGAAVRRILLSRWQDTKVALCQLLPYWNEDKVPERKSAISAQRDVSAIRVKGKKINQSGTEVVQNVSLSTLPRLT